MHRLLTILLIVLTFTSAAITQDKTPLPSEDTVNAFLQHMFGYDTTMTWKIVEIRPSSAPGIADVSVLMSTPQGQQNPHLFITAAANVPLSEHHSVWCGPVCAGSRAAAEGNQWSCPRPC